MGWERHFDDDQTCTAPGCQVRCPRQHWIIAGLLFRACSKDHAEAAAWHYRLDQLRKEGVKWDT